MPVERNDIAAVGRARYSELRSALEASHWGRMFVMDVNTGDYEIDDDYLTATLRLRERNPGAITWGERIGYPPPYRMSSRGQSSSRMTGGRASSTRTSDGTALPEARVNINIAGIPLRPLCPSGPRRP